MACQAGSGSGDSGLMLWNHKTGRRMGKKPRRPKCDLLATESRLFLDKRSHVKLSGKVKLFGQDMRVMHDFVMARDNFRCVQCGAVSQLEMDHIITRARGGDDSESNLRILCKICHTERHNRVPRFSFSRDAA